MTPGLTTRPLAEVAERVRRGRVKAQTVVEEAVANHASRGSTLNAYVEWGGDQAIEQARTVDRLVKEGSDPGPLAGIPVSVKDLFGVNGFTTRAGTPRALPAKWEEEGTLVRRLKSAGAIIMGKTHTVEMAYGGVGTNPHWGTPRNPWDTSNHRVPGGSSSGAGVSLWEGSAMIAVGSDTGGSIRIPASVTGNVGLKHTTGRWPTDGVVPLSSTLDTVGFLTRTVADTAFAFGVVDDPDEGTLGLGEGRADLEGLRIAIVESDIWKKGSPGVWETFEAAMAEMEAAGAQVTRITGDLFDTSTALYLGGGVISAECSAFLERELPGWTQVLDPIVARRLEGARGLPAAAYIDTLEKRKSLATRARALFQNLDLLVTPTVPLTPPLVSDLETPDAYMSANRAMLSGTCPVNFLDLCAITLPIGLDSCTMPVGLQLICNHGADVELIGLALATERVLGVGSDRLQ